MSHTPTGSYFVFIDPGRRTPSKNGRKQIRSHVMRDYAAKRRQVRTQRLPPRALEPRMQAPAYEDVAVTSPRRCLLEHQDRSEQIEACNVSPCFMKELVSSSVHSRAAEPFPALESLDMTLGEGNQRRRTPEFGIHVFAQSLPSVGRTVSSGDSKAITSTFMGILNYFKVEFKAAPWQNDLNDGLTSFWIPLCMTSDVLLSTVLALSTRHMSLAKVRPAFALHERAGPGGHTWDPAVAFLRFEKWSTRSVNQALQNIRQAASNATIGAVAVIANWESFAGDITKVARYLRALERLVDLRGSIEALPPQLVIRIQRVDAHYAAYCSTMPRFPLIYMQELDLKETVPIPKCLQVHLDCFRHLAVAFSDPILSAIVEPHLQRIFCDLRSLTKLFALWTGGHTRLLALANDFFELRIGAIEMQLLSIQNRTDDAMDHVVQQCCRLAALLYLQQCFRLWHAVYNNSMTVIIVRRLAQELATVPLRSIQDTPRLRLMMWVLFTGLHSSSIKNFSETFADSLRDVLEKLCIVSWEEVHDTLRTFFYWDKIHCQPFRDIWDDIRSLRFLPRMSVGGHKSVFASDLRITPSNGLAR